MTAQGHRGHRLVCGVLAEAQADPCGIYSGDPTDALEATATGETGLGYDASFVYNLATPAPEGCYEFFSPRRSFSLRSHTIRPD